MRVYHYLSKKWGLDDVKNRRVRISRIKDVNDPFELIPVALNNGTKRQVFKRWREKFNAEIGLICFSAGTENPVQWSHYADRHRGMALGFDIPDEMLAEVEYRRKRLPAAYFDKLLDESPLVSDEAMRKILAVKYTHWRYEAEYRRWCGINADNAIDEHHFQDFGDGIRLKEIVVGANSDATRADVTGALNGLTGVRVWKARLAFQSYRVVKNRDSKLWL